MTDVVEYLIEDKNSYSNDITNIMEKNTAKKWIS